MLCCMVALGLWAILRTEHFDVGCSVLMVVAPIAVACATALAVDSVAVLGASPAARSTNDQMALVFNGIALGSGLLVPLAWLIQHL